MAWISWEGTRKTESPHLTEEDTAGSRVLDLSRRLAAPGGAGRAGQGEPS